MAISIIGTPDTFSPVYNPCIFYLDSTNKNLEGFRYIADIHPKNNPNKLGRFQLSKRLGDGYGVVDLFLGSELSYFLNQDLNDFSISTQNYYEYDMKFGEQYVYYVPFDLHSNWFGYQAFSSSTNTFGVGGFQFNDEVILSGNVPSLDGVHNVLATGTDYVVLQTPYDAASSAMTACTIVYSNHRKTTFTGLTNSSGYCVFNGVISHQDLISYTSSTYNMNVLNQNRQFLSDVPTGYTVRRENKMWLHYHSTTPSVIKYMQVITNNGTYWFVPPASASGMTNVVACGIYNLENFDSAPIVVSGSLPMFDSNTSSYSVQFGDFEESWNPISELKTFSVNQKCNKFTNVELYFIDKKGSIIPVNFELNSVRTITVNKSEYQTILGDLSNGRWRFDSTESGLNVLNTVEVEQLDIQTDWQTEAEARYFRQLITTQKAWIKEFGKLWPVIIRTTNLPILNKNNRKNINQRIIIEYANKNSMQNF